jgi:hypothetical protein
MQHKAVKLATIRVANGPGGTLTAGETNVGLRIGKPKLIGRLVCYGLCGAAATLLPMRQAMGGSILPTGFLDVSTLASNGDQNPYGVAFVPNGFPSGGKLNPGDILVSNFNNATTSTGGNTQGTGTTITKVAPDGETSTFFQGTFAPPTDGGLTTALGVLQRGFVVVGQLPNSNGTPEPGSLLFLDKNGQLVLKYTNAKVNGPWDLAIDDHFDHASIFVSNVLSGTVVRLDVSVGPSNVAVPNPTKIAQGYAFGPNAAAFVVGPTGLAFDAQTDVLYVASTFDNQIFKIQNAETANNPVKKGILVYDDPVHLHGPLALALTPSGTLLTSNGDAINVMPPPLPPNQLPSEIVEFTKDGQFIGQLSIDSVPGAAFGIAIVPVSANTARIALANDDDNTIIVQTLNAGE